jgi:tRNA-dihydrouridine synthase B
LRAVIDVVARRFGHHRRVRPRENRNAVRIARLAEAAGISMLTVNGRTRADLYHGEAEYDTIAAVKAAVRIPVVANGDIDSPAKARAVLAATGADAIMIGRAAQGRPWLFREIAHFLATGEVLPPPRIAEIRQVMNEHLEDHYAFYGEYTGVRTARKHIGWYTRGLSGANAFRHRMNTLDTTWEQLLAVNAFFDEQQALSDRLVYVDDDMAGHGEPNRNEPLAA